jgi:predicted dehydrogenase
MAQTLVTRIMTARSVDVPVALARNSAVPGAMGAASAGRATSSEARLLAAALPANAAPNRIATRPMPRPSRKSRKPSGASTTVRFAVVGLGHIAQVAVLPAFRQVRRATLTALVSGSGEKLEQLQQRYRVPHTFSYEEFDDCLACPDVDAVFVALPNDMHRDCCLRALHAGKHVLCEKPLALSVRDAEELLAAARSADVKLMTAYRLHFEPANLSAIELVRSGRIGEPRYFTSSFSFQVTDPENIRLQWARGGGPVFDIGTYCINAARYLFANEPEEVVALTANTGDRRFREVEETAAAILRFPGGCLATIAVSFGASDSARYELVGTKGSIVLDPAFEYAEGLTQTVTVNGRSRTKRFPKLDQFAGELEAFTSCVIENREPEASAREAMGDLRVIEAIFASAERGRAVRLEPFSRRRRPTMRQVERKPGIRPPRPVCVASPYN